MCERPEKYIDSRNRRLQDAEGLRHAPENAEEATCWISRLPLSGRMPCGILHEHRTADDNEQNKQNEDRAGGRPKTSAHTAYSCSVTHMLHLPIKR